MKKRIFSIIAALALVVALLPAGIVPAHATTHPATDSDTFLKALKDAHDGDTIQVSGSFVVKNPVSNNDSLVIDKAVTIQGGGLTFWYCGILLAKDVTFKDITLGLASNMRNAIMANGHTLTLENVQRDPTARYIHLFCGGQSGGTQADTAQGGHGQIILKGNTNLGAANIYAGSISTDGQPNRFDKPATVTVESSFTGTPIEHIYASGAMQTPTTEDDWFNTKEIDPPLPITAKFPVSGDVTFNLYGTAVKAVDGDTGTGKYAAVQYDGSGYLNDGLVLANIGGLNVHSGNLIPASGSSMFAGAPLTIASGAILGLNNLGGTVTAGSFTGGGNLILGVGQQLTVTGAVSGTTTVAIGGLFNGHSQEIPNTAGHTYIDAAGSGENSFTFASYASRPDIKLVKEGNAWKVEGAAVGKILVEDFILGSSVAAAGGGSADLPMPATFVDTGVNNPCMQEIKGLKISVDGRSANPLKEGEEGYEAGYTVYKDTVNSWLLYVAENDLSIVTAKFDGAFSSGSYTIAVTIPAVSSATGQDITRTATLEVKEADSNGKVAIPKPSAITGLVYNSQRQTGVLAGGGYTLDGEYTATDAGPHTATATLEEDFVWADGSTESVEIKWSIAKAEGPAAPAGLSVTAPTAFGGTDGKISGTTAEMEYAADASFTDPKPCAAGNTAVAAGSYYVRYKTDKNHEAGAGVMVTVPQGPVTVKAITIATPAGKTEYKTGEKLDVTGLTLSVTMSDNSTYTVPVAASMVSGFNSNVAAASQRLTVTYGGKMVSYTISITGDPVSGGGSGGSSGGGSTGGSSGGSSGTGGSNPGGSSTVKNPDGSTTTTATDKSTGAVTTTTTDQAGNVTQIVTQTDGSSVVTVSQANGTAATVNTSASGQVEAKVRLSVTDVSEARERGEAVELPIPAVEASRNTTSAPVVTVNTGSSQPVKVEIPTAAPTPGTVAVLVRADGTEQIIKASVPTDNGIVAQLSNGATVKIVDNSKRFSDVPAGNWAADTISFASARELFSGTGPDTFSPDLPMTRAMLVTVLARYDGADLSGGTTWYEKGVEWAVANKVSDGSSPNGNITREQLVVMLWRYAGSPASSAVLNGFADAGQVSGYAQDALRWAVANGVISGYGNDRLDPQGQASRAQVAQMLRNVIEKI